MLAGCGAPETEGGSDQQPEDKVTAEFKEGEKEVVTDTQGDDSQQEQDGQGNQEGQGEGAVQDALQDIDMPIVADMDRIDSGIDDAERHEAADAEDAASKAGIDGGFKVPSAITMGGSEMALTGFSYSDGVAVATYGRDGGAVEIRRGTGADGTVTPSDKKTIEKYAKSWVIDPGGVTTVCRGNEEGQVLFAQWYQRDGTASGNPDDAYSLHSVSFDGGDAPMGDEEVGMAILEVCGFI